MSTDTARRTPAPGRTPLAARALRAAGDWLPIIPFMLVTGGLLLGSGVWLVVVSFQGAEGGWSLDAWRAVTAPGLNRRAIVTTLQLGLVVATLCAVLGTVLAWYIAHLADRGRGVAKAVLNVAANFGGASLAVAMIATFGSVGFAQLLLQDWFGVGLPIDLYGFWGYVCVYMYFCLPLYVLLVMPAMRVLRQEYWEAVQVASGGRLHYWRSVGGPVLAPFVTSGWVILFAWSMGQFSVPFALVGTAGGEPLITLRLGSFLFGATAGDNRFQRAAAMAVILIALAIVALATYRWVARRALRRLAVA